jgi:hypothetical protein
LRFSKAGESAHTDVLNTAPRRSAEQKQIDIAKCDAHRTRKLIEIPLVTHLLGKARLLLSKKYFA